MDGTEYFGKAIDNVVDGVTTPAAKQVGKTLADMFYLIFHPIQNLANRKKVQSAHDLKQYKKSIEAKPSDIPEDKLIVPPLSIIGPALEQYKQSIKTKLSEVPEDKLIIPPLSIIGPALEASKYYIEDEDLREMFAKLIAMACHSDMKNKIHRSFVEIIKQLSPIDCSNLYLFCQSHDYPTGDILVNYGGKDVRIVFSKVFLSNKDIQDITIQSASIQNLERLGLLKVDYSMHLAKEHYKIIFESDQYRDCVKHFKNIEVIEDIEKIKGIDLRKATVFSTNFGRDFLAICV